MCVQHLLLVCFLLVCVDQGCGTIQTCINCGLSWLCDPFYQNVTGVNSGQTCNTTCGGDPSCNLGVFRYQMNRCSLSDCTNVGYSADSTAYRTSSNTECPVYSLSIRLGHIPTSGTVYSSIWSEHECLNLCLDTVNCRLAGFHSVDNTCTLSDGTVTTYDPSSNTYARDCTSGCDKIYTQTCHRCSPAWYTPGQLGEMTNVLLQQECLTSPLWTQAASVQYKPDSASCHYYDTAGITLSHSSGSQKIIRKSCYNECLDFTILEYNGFRGNCVPLATKGPDMYAGQHNCIEWCMDTPTCKGVNFNTNYTCYYLTDDCDASIPMIADSTYNYMFITCLDLSAPITQTCTNCGVNGCQAAYNTTTVSTWNECHAQCEGSDDCTTATYDTASMQCLMHQCSAPEQNYNGLMSFRKSINTDCQKYEIYSSWSHQGTCEAMRVIQPLWNSIHCTEICLDTPGCRAISIDWGAAICSLHNSSCSEIVYQANSVYKIKYCLSDCAPSTVQTCMSCKPEWSCAGAHYLSANNVTKPFNIDTSSLQSNDAVKQIWYHPPSRQYQYVDCPHVERNGADYNIVYRKSCSTACVKYEVFSMTDYRGTCTVIAHIYNVKSWESCRTKCLDVDNCRGVTLIWDGTNTECSLHDCDDYTYAPGYFFTRRRCIDDCPGATVIQECVGCSANDKCITYNSQTSVLLTEDCVNMKNADSDSTMALYDRTSDVCELSQCTWVTRDAFNIVLRDSCNTECPRYEIFIMWNYTGVCDEITVDRGGWTTFEYCTARCLDMPNCRAMTFDLTDYYCTYFTCANKTHSPVQMLFLVKRCLDNEPPRVHDQTCVGCTPSDKCQTRTTYTESVTGTECKASFDSDVNGYAYHYCPETRTCDVVDCSWIQQHGVMTNVVYRKSTSSECPIYNIYVFGYHTATCPEIDRDYGTISFEYCMNRCLDMDGCRAITFYLPSTDCSYHSCATKQYDVSYADFHVMTRECLTEHVYHPSKLYTQIIRDSRSDCGNGINKEANIDSAHDCDTSCPDCDVIVYHSTSRSCSQHECELPNPLGEGQTLLRRTNNSECLHAYMTYRHLYVPTCSPYLIQNGFTPSLQCISYCLDDPTCMAVALDTQRGMCTYYSCSSGFVQDMGVEFLIVKHCLYDCPAPVIQTCLNCRQGSICQPAFSTAPMTLATSQSYCVNYTSCEGMSYDNSLSMWNLFQCGRVQQQYNSTFYRKSCDSDCTIYEMYVVQGFGTCTEISQMTQDFVNNPEVCYERCLDASGCRGVTFNAGTCTYHQCDCFNQSTNGETFMWRYCLTYISNATHLSDPTDSTMFPSVCSNETATTTQSPTTTSAPTTSPGTTTPAPTTSPGTTTPAPTTSPGTTTPAPTTSPGTTTPVPTTSPGTTTPVPTTSPGTTTPVPTTSPGTTTPAPTTSPATTTPAPTTSTATTTPVPTTSPATTTPAPTTSTATTTPVPTTSPATTTPAPTTSTATTTPASTTSPATTTPVPTTSPGTTTPVPTTSPGTTTPVPTTSPGTTTPAPTTSPGTTTPAPTTSPGTTTPAPTTSPGTTTPVPTTSPGTTTPVPTTSSATTTPVPTTSPGTTTPASTSASLLTASPTPVPQVLAIYIMPCNCRTGTFGNLSQIEIIEGLVQNLTIDVESTSTFYRKLNSAVDDRSSSKTIGMIGVIIISIIGCLIVIMDLPTLLKIFKKPHHHQPTVKSKVETQCKEKMA